MTTTGTAAGGRSGASNGRGGCGSSSSIDGTEGSPDPPSAGSSGCDVIPSPSPDSSPTRVRIGFSRSASSLSTRSKIWRNMSDNRAVVASSTSLRTRSTARATSGSLACTSWPGTVPAAAATPRRGNAEPSPPTRQPTTPSTVPDGTGHRGPRSRRRRRSGRDQDPVRHAGGSGRRRRTSRPPTPRAPPPVVGGGAGGAHEHPQLGDRGHRGELGELLVQIGRAPWWRSPPDPWTAPRRQRSPSPPDGCPGPAPSAQPHRRDGARYRPATSTSDPTT